MPDWHLFDPNLKASVVRQVASLPYSKAMEIEGFASLVDDCALRRAGLEKMLAARGIELNLFVNPTEFLAYRPASGVVLVHDSADAIWSLRAGLGQVSSDYLQIAYSAAPDWRRAVSAMRSGALDYFDVTGDPDEIVAKIISVQIANGAEMAPAVPKNELLQDKFSSLSDREKQVFEGVIAGQTNRAIAGQLGISYRTVEIHRSNMLRKIGARNSTDAVRIAFETKLGEKDAASSPTSPRPTRIPQSLGIVPKPLSSKGSTLSHRQDEAVNIVEMTASTLNS